jgi:hypothetical protein
MSGVLDQVESRTFSAREVRLESGVVLLCLRPPGGGACGAGGVMAWERGRGEGARGRGGP